MSIGQSVSKHRFACVTAVCAIAAACGSFALGIGRSIWFDEGYTLIVESQPFARMMDLLKVDVHPPLYYLLLRMWISVFGSDVMALRAMSCVFCGLTVLMSMVLLRFMAGERHALLASPFVVFAPLMLRYGYEIRMYSLIPFLSVLGTYLLLRAMREDGMSGSASVGTRFDGPSQDCRSTMVDRLRHSGGVGHVLAIHDGIRVDDTRVMAVRRVTPSWPCASFPTHADSLRARRGAVHSMDSFRGRPVRLLDFAPVEGDHESE